METTTNTLPGLEEFQENYYRNMGDQPIMLSLTQEEFHCLGEYVTKREYSPPELYNLLEELLSLHMYYNNEYAKQYVNKVMACLNFKQV